MQIESSVQCLLTQAVHNNYVLVVAAVLDKHSEQHPLYSTVNPARPVQHNSHQYQA